MLLVVKQTLTRILPRTHTHTHDEETHENDLRKQTQFASKFEAILNLHLRTASQSKRHKLQFERAE